jgi:hypothetical protein
MSEASANMPDASDKSGEGPLTGSGRSGKTGFGWPQGLSALKSQRIAENRSSTSTLSTLTSACDTKAMEVAHSIGNIEV